MKRDKALGKVLKEQFIKEFFKYGFLSKEDLKLSDVEFSEKFLNVLRTEPWALTIDHRDDIVKQADFYLTRSQYNYARIFYAMFFEHSLNNLIHQQCFKLKIDKKTTN